MADVPVEMTADGGLPEVADGGTADSAGVWRTGLGVSAEAAGGEESGVAEGRTAERKRREEKETILPLAQSAEQVLRGGLLWQDEVGFVIVVAGRE